MAESNKKSRKALLIGIIALLLIVNGVQLFMMFNDKDEIKVKDEQIEAKKVFIDSLETEFTKMEMAIQSKIDTITSLNGQASELKAQLAQIRREKAAIRASVAGKDRSIAKWKDEYQQILAQYKLYEEEAEGKIQRLTAERDSLFQENTGLKQSIVSRDDSIMNLKQVKADLNKQVEVASVLKARNVRVAYIDSKGRVKTDDDNEFKGKRVEKIRVTFNIDDNKVAKTETKQAYLRMIEPSGSTVYDMSTGGGSFIAANGEEMFYSAMQDFMFSNQQPEISFVYEKGNDFADGNYTVELYAEGHKIGQGTFKIK